MANKVSTGLVSVLLSILAAGCVGEIGGSDSGANGEVGASAQLDVETSNIRRMTPAQYLNTARDLFGDPDLKLTLDPDTGETVSQLGAEKLNAAAELIASRSDIWTAKVFPCDTSGEGTPTCADDFIKTFGRRAFRHPLSPDETSWLRSVFDQAHAGQSFKDSLLITLKVMLQSPQLIYFLELGNEPPAGLTRGVRPLTSFERASRLSFFLWNTTPDDALLDAAEKGALDTAEGVQAQAARLLADPRAHQMVKDLFVGWLELDGGPTHPSLEEASKSAAAFPEDSPDLRAAMRKEVNALVEHEMFDKKGSAQSLLTTTDAFVNASLAKLYGVSGPTDDATFQWVSLPSEQRAGLFTRAAFLTVYARGDIKSPIRRGAYVVKKALCVKLGQPPPNAADTPVTGGTVDQNGMLVRRTVRQDVAAKTASTTCQSCHSIINPVGFAFDHFDGLGRWEDTEKGQDAMGPYTLPIDTTGAVPNFDAQGHMQSGVLQVDGAVAMSQALAESDGVGACLADKWFHAALRRGPSDRDARTAESLRQAMASGESLDVVVNNVVSSDAFLYLRPSKEN